MAEWNDRLDDLAALDCAVIAASVDTPEDAAAMRERSGAAFDFAHSATRADADAIGAWWADAHDGHIQPTEFILGRGGIALGTLYASGPVGRMSADEAITMIRNRERQRRG